MSFYFRQNSLPMSCESTNSWIVLSTIEQRIKQKIEQAGTPLKDWNVQINYGIKTGLNEAFIINKESRDDLVAKSPKSAEIIRPILRGRDIQKYNANWDNLYLIVTHNGYIDSAGNPVQPINIEEYSAVKTHLNQYWDKISSRQDQGITPYNLRSCIYMEEFFKHKIIYPDIMRLPREEKMLKQYPYFYFDYNNFYKLVSLISI